MKETSQNLGSLGVDFQGARLFPGYLGLDSQIALRDSIRDVVKQAPLRQYQTPSGRKMSVRMSSAGRCGWISDLAGYRYEDRQPDGRPWPALPEIIKGIWVDVTGLKREPDCCLVNYYGEASRMGLHQDADEGDYTWPVVSISLGDDALFRVGTTTRKGPTKSVWLKSGDVVVLQGESRLAFHGIDRVRARTSTLLTKGGRLNVTLRIVDRSASDAHSS